MENVVWTLLVPTRPSLLFVGGSGGFALPNLGPGSLRLLSPSGRRGNFLYVLRRAPRPGEGPPWVRGSSPKGKVGVKSPVGSVKVTSLVLGPEATSTSVNARMDVFNLLVLASSNR